MSDQLDGPREVAQALLERAEAGRLERGSALEVRELTTKGYGEGNFAVFGFVSSYACNIKFLGRRRTVQCECEDFKRMAQAEGPCKHLVALAKAVSK